MLRHLTVQNFAIVDKVDLTFEWGFNVLTGETGAGKSLLVDALYFLLGGRLDPALLRSGEDKAVAEALFQLDLGSPALAKMNEWGLPAPEGEILLRREYAKSSGKTRSTLNGSLATAAMVAELGDLLLDLHGQHEHQAIFVVSSHRRLVDAFGALDADAASVGEAYRVLAALLDEKRKLGGDERDAARREDLLAFQVGELSAAGLEELDETAFQSAYQTARHAEKITESLRLARQALEEGSGGAIGALGAAASALRDASRVDPTLEDWLKRAQELQEALNQLSFEVSRRLEAGEATAEDLQTLTERMDSLHTLKKKYGNTLEDVRAYYASIQGELDALRHRGERLKVLGNEIEKAAEAYRAAASRLSAARGKAGARLASETRKLLSDLGLEGAKLEVVVAPQEEADSPVTVAGKGAALSPHGWDTVEFLFSANPGEPLRPLAKVASGGEASRVMLALKAALAKADEVPTLVFDEIDTGVGARTASAVGKVMGRLAKGKQVLCISHLAPLAALGKSHSRVLKETRDGKTFTRVEKLAGRERVEEVARMLGGEPLTAASRKHALELLQATEG